MISLITHLAPLITNYSITHEVKAFLIKYFVEEFLQYYIFCANAQLFWWCKWYNQILHCLFFCVCQKFDFKRYKYKYLCASPRHSIAWFIVSAKIDHYTFILALQILHTKSNTTSFRIKLTTFQNNKL